ncbi:NPC intracellular cholesterol transporter 2 [Pelodytes ibericus]
MAVRELAVLLALAICALAEPLVYKDCGCSKGAIVALDVSPCKNDPCHLVKGLTYTINVTFTANEFSNTTTAVVHGIIAEIKIPFPIPEPDGCKSGIACPIKSGQTYTYLTQLPIKKEYPAMKLIVKWQLVDKAGENIFCWLIPVIITNE